MVSKRDPGCSQVSSLAPLSEPRFHEPQGKTWSQQVAPLFQGCCHCSIGGASVASAHKLCCIIRRVFPRLSARTEPVPAQPAGCQVTAPGDPAPPTSTPACLHPGMKCRVLTGYPISRQVQGSRPHSIYPQAQVSLGHSWVPQRLAKSLEASGKPGGESEDSGRGFPFREASEVSENQKDQA